MKGFTPRFILAALLISGAALFLQARARSEVFPPHLALNQFPTQLNGWSGSDVPIDRETLEVLGPGEFLLRIYQNPQKTQYADLFIAYFRSQRTGQKPHSPKNCLPGAGWVETVNDEIRIKVPSALSPEEKRAFEELARSSRFDPRRS